MMPSDYLPDAIPLGKVSEYITEYAPELLVPISRVLSRRQLDIQAGNLPFRGMDIWTAYELSWLNPKGLPQVAMAEFRFPCNSPNIIESKSLKLYLNSFTQSRFDNVKAVLSALEADLAAVAGAPVMVDMLSLSHVPAGLIGKLTGECLDGRDIEIDHYQPDANLLSLDVNRGVVTEAVYSDLLKTNCPVTGQPDWASVYISYRGDAICKDSLLRYIVSFRQHQDFHEHCVERIYVDIKTRFQPEKLTVYARYTRRGGLDINPFRTDNGEHPVDIRLIRQ